MSINYTYQTRDGEVITFAPTACFGDVAKPFAESFRAGAPHASITYAPDIEAVKEDRVLLTGANPNFYEPYIFLKDLLTTPGPIQTAIDSINNILGEECIDYTKCNIVMPSKVPYKVALLALSLVRYVEEQPSLISRYMEIKDQCDSVTQAFLWAFSSHHNAGYYGNHDILLRPVQGVIASPKKIKEIFGRINYVTYMQAILSPAHEDTLFVKANKINLSGGRATSREVFLEHQKQILSLLKDSQNDIDDYITA